MKSAADYHQPCCLCHALSPSASFHPMWDAIFLTRFNFGYVTWDSSGPYYTSVTYLSLRNVLGENHGVHSPYQTAGTGNVPMQAPTVSTLTFPPGAGPLNSSYGRHHTRLSSCSYGLGHVYGSDPYSINTRHPVTTLPQSLRTMLSVETNPPGAEREILSSWQYHPPYPVTNLTPTESRLRTGPGQAFHPVFQLRDCPGYMCTVRTRTSTNVWALNAFEDLDRSIGSNALRNSVIGTLIQPISMLHVHSVKRQRSLALPTSYPWASSQWELKDPPTAQPDGTPPPGDVDLAPPAYHHFELNSSGSVHSHPQTPPPLQSHRSTRSLNLHVHPSTPVHSFTLGWHTHVPPLLWVRRSCRGGHFR